MNNSDRSNITISSNVYLVSRERPFDDKKFLEHVFEKKALERLPQHYSLSAAQINIRNLSMGCSYNKTAVPGLVRGEDGLYQVLRCNRLGSCPYAMRNRCGIKIKLTWQYKK